MPHQNKKHTPEKHSSQKMPVMFYQSVPAEEIMKEKKQVTEHQSQTNHSTTRERQIYLWAGVSVVMLALFFFWAKSLPAMLKTAPGEAAAQDLFDKSQKNLSVLFEEQQKTAEQVKNVLISAANEIASSSAVATPTLNTTSTNNFTAEQLKELASKIKTNKTKK